MGLGGWETNEQSPFTSNSSQAVRKLHKPRSIDTNQYNSSNGTDDLLPAAKKTKVTLWVSKSFLPSREDFISEVRVVALARFSRGTDLREEVYIKRVYDLGSPTMAAFTLQMQKTWP